MSGHGVLRGCAPARRARRASSRASARSRSPAGRWPRCRSRRRTARGRGGRAPPAPAPRTAPTARLRTRRSLAVALTGELAGLDRGGLVLQHAGDERFADDAGFDLGLPAQRVEELDTGPQVGVVDRDRHLLVRVEQLAEQRGVVAEEGTRRFGLVERRRLREACPRCRAGRRCRPRSPRWRGGRRQPLAGRPRSAPRGSR